MFIIVIQKMKPQNWRVLESGGGTSTSIRGRAIFGERGSLLVSLVSYFFCMLKDINARNIYI